jgi:hypothetical protein
VKVRNEKNDVLAKLQVSEEHHGEAKHADKKNH